MLVISFATRRKIVLERVHVWWKSGNLPEYEDEVKVKKYRCTVEPSKGRASQPGCLKNFVGIRIRGKEGAPSAISPRYFVVITVCHNSSKYVEWYQSGVDNQGKEVIAGGTGWRTSFGGPHKVVDCVECCRNIHARCYSYYPSFCVLSSANANHADQYSNCSNELEHPKKELNPSRPIDLGFYSRAHWLRICIAVRKDEVAVRMPIEIDQRAFRLWLRRWRRPPARHCHSLGVESIVRVCCRVSFWRIVKVRLPAAHLLLSRK